MVKSFTTIDPRKAKGGESLGKQISKMWLSELEEAAKKEKDEAEAQKKEQHGGIQWSTSASELSKKADEKLARAIKETYNLKDDDTVEAEKPKED